MVAAQYQWRIPIPHKTTLVSKTNMIVGRGGGRGGLSLCMSVILWPYTLASLPRRVGVGRFFANQADIVCSKRETSWGVVRVAHGGWTASFGDPLVRRASTPCVYLFLGCRWRRQWLLRFLVWPLQREKWVYMWNSRVGSLPYSKHCVMLSFPLNGVRGSPYRMTWSTSTTVMATLPKTARKDKKYPGCLDHATIGVFDIVVANERQPHYTYDIWLLYNVGANRGQLKHILRSIYV